MTETTTSPTPALAALAAAQRLDSDLHSPDILRSAAGPSLSEIADVQSAYLKAVALIGGELLEEQRAANLIAITASGHDSPSLSGAVTRYVSRVRDRVMGVEL